MNYSTAIFIINDDARAITVTYEAHDGAPRTIFKTLDKTIKIDDFVIVPTDTRHKMTVCKVVEVDVDTWMDTQANIEWVLGRVNLADANQLKDQENNAIAKIKEAEKLKKRRELRASMEAALADGGESLKLLSMPAQSEDVAKIEAA